MSRPAGLSWRPAWPPAPCAAPAAAAPRAWPQARLCPQPPVSAWGSSLCRACAGLSETAARILGPAASQPPPGRCIAGWLPGPGLAASHWWLRRARPSLARAPAGGACPCATGAPASESWRHTGAPGP
uniref:Putative secreted protein n=1 Tax=Ixodes ricinus TaxID=34613 RepID=A0A6B0URF6_IXORI